MKDLGPLGRKDLVYIYLLTKCESWDHPSVYFSRTWDNNFLGTTVSGHRMQASLGSPVAVSQRSRVELGIFRMSNSMWPRVSQ